MRLYGAISSSHIEKYCISSPIDELVFFFLSIQDCFFKIHYFDCYRLKRAVINIEFHSVKLYSSRLIIEKRLTPKICERRLNIGFQRKYNKTKQNFYEIHTLNGHELHLVTMGNQFCCTDGSNQNHLDNMERKNRRKGKNSDRESSNRSECLPYQEHHNLLLNATQHTERSQRNEAEGGDHNTDRILNFSCEDSKRESLHKPVSLPKYNDFEAKLKANACLEKDISPIEKSADADLSAPEDPESQASKVQEFLEAIDTLKRYLSEKDRLVAGTLGNGTEQKQWLSDQKVTEISKPHVVNEKGGQAGAEQEAVATSLQSLPFSESNVNEIKPTLMTEEHKTENEAVENLKQNLEEEGIRLPSELLNDLEGNEDHQEGLQVVTPKSEVIQENVTEAEENRLINEINEPANPEPQEKRNSMAPQEEEIVEGHIVHESSKNSEKEKEEEKEKTDSEQREVSEKSESSSIKPEINCKEVLLEDTKTKIEKNNELEDNKKDLQHEEAKCYTEISEEIPDQTEEAMKKSFADSRMSLDNDFAETHDHSETTSMGQLTDKNFPSEIFDKASEASRVSSTRKSTISPSVIKSGKFQVDDINFPPLDQLLEKPRNSMSKPKSKVMAFSQTSLGNRSNSTSTPQSQVLEEKMLPRRNRKFRRYSGAKH